MKISIKHKKLAIGILIVALIVISELIAKFYLGLGDPPLMMSDPDIEYLYQPLQDGCQLHNRYIYNAYSMRSEQFSIKKTDVNEVRILVFGDSVINGGNLTDQNELATEIIRRRLTEKLNKPVVVGNISAGSWGPGNYLAYAKKYGLFDADIIVVILSSHDYADNPTFEPIVGINPMFPDKKPFLAITEAIVRYLPRYLPSNKSIKTKKEPNPEDIKLATDAIRSLADLSQEHGAVFLIALYPEKDEIQGDAKIGKRVFFELATEIKIQTIDLFDAFQTAIEAGEEPYRDNIHPNANGQRLIADSLFPVIFKILENKSNQESICE